MSHGRLGIYLEEEYDIVDRKSMWNILQEVNEKRMVEAWS